MTKNRTGPAVPSRRSRPKRGLPGLVWVALGGLLLVVAGLVFLARPGSQAAPVAPQVTGQPKLAVDRDKIDFGTVPLDKPVKATFKLTNVGDKPLLIEDKPTIQVKQGC